MLQTYTIASVGTPAVSLKITCTCLSPSSCWSRDITIRQSIPGETELLCKIYSGPVKMISWIILVCLSSSAKALLALQRMDLSYNLRHFFLCHHRRKSTMATQVSFWLFLFPLCGGFVTCIQYDRTFDFHSLDKAYNATKL